MGTVDNYYMCLYTYFKEKYGEYIGDFYDFINNLPLYLFDNNIRDSSIYHIETISRSFPILEIIYNKYTQRLKYNNGYSYIEFLCQYNLIYHDKLNQRLMKIKTLLNDK